ncbi:MAG: hypothetical protein Kilf2KO_40700 [Rhodospirillales bacterium]
MLAGISWTVSALGKVLFALGSLGFLLLFLILFLGHSYPVPPNWNLPLPFTPTVLFAPGKGLFSVAQGDSRMQAYDLQGRFEKGWSINPGGGLICTLLVDDRIYVFSSRNEQAEVFDLDGNRLEEEGGPPTETACYDAPPTVEVTAQLSGWTVRPAETGAPVILIDRPWWQYATINIWTCFAIIVIGGLLKVLGLSLTLNGRAKLRSWMKRRDSTKSNH